MTIASSARPFAQVVFEIGVACGDLGGPRRRAGAQRRASEIRVDDHAGRVDYRPQRERVLLQPIRGSTFYRGCDVGDPIASREGLANAIGFRTQRLDDSAMPEPRFERCDLRPLAEQLDRRNEGAVVHSDEGYNTTFHRDV
jgi:hypothetical protein